MKKFLLALLPFMMLCACGEKQKVDVREDSVRPNVPSINDTISQDSITVKNEESNNNELKEEKTKDDKSAEYDELIDQYVKTVNKYGKLRWDMRDWDQQEKLFNKYHKLEKQINKIKDNLNKKQLSKFKKAKAEAIKWEDWN